MTRPPFALQYRKCTHEELLHFLRVRTGNLRRRPNRHTCIRKLKQLDREVTFRFFDRIPEMRNRIYELLLNHNNEAAMISRFTSDQGIRNYTPPQASKAYPALLRVSRQVYNEACGILYDQSVFFTNSANQFLLRTKLFCFQYVRSGRLRTISRAVCRHDLLHIKHLTMNVNTWKDELSALSPHILPALLESFGTQNPLKTLKLVCNQRALAARNPYPNQQVQEYFRELRHLPATTTLELVGFTDELEGKIREVINRPAK